MYTIEVEIALDSGRPMCIRNSDVDVEWPIEVDDSVLFPIHFRVDNRTLESIRRRWSRKMDLLKFRISLLYLDFLESSEGC
jgi:hypothetical protein